MLAAHQDEIGTLQGADAAIVLGQSARLQNDFAHPFLLRDRMTRPYRTAW